MRLPAAAADELATRILRGGIEQGLLPDQRLPDWDRYKIFRQRIRSSFIVPETSVTPLMARLLYCLAALARPERVLCVGCYVGNALAWMAGPGFGPDPVYRGALALGVDIDRAAVQAATQNFARAGMANRVECRCMDGLDIPRLDQRFDLVLLDADDPDSRKAIYYPLLDAIYPLVEDDGLILAHDIAVPRFREQLGRYRELMRDSARFAGTASLEIDDCGLEVSRKAGQHAVRAAEARRAAGGQVRA
jgi:predicted O-methyltransferase YrrM